MSSKKNLGRKYGCVRLKLLLARILNLREIYSIEDLDLPISQVFEWLAKEDGMLQIPTNNGSNPILKGAGSLLFARNSSI
jgi:hypothetical protein